MVGSVTRSVSAPLARRLDEARSSLDAGQHGVRVGVGDLFGAEAPACVEPDVRLVAHPEQPHGEQLRIADVEVARLVAFAQRVLPHPLVLALRGLAEALVLRAQGTTFDAHHVHLVGASCAVLDEVAHVEAQPFRRRRTELSDLLGFLDQVAGQPIEDQPEQVLLRADQVVEVPAAHVERVTQAGHPGVVETVGGKELRGDADDALDVAFAGARALRRHAARRLLDALLECSSTAADRHHVPFVKLGSLPFGAAR